jgi:ubiquinone/menaquinone biosynthesis C-methylase UbiE
MTKRTGAVACAVWVLLLSSWLPAQVANQPHHPPESASAYIQALEDPGRDAWQKPQEVMEKLALKPGERVADLGAGSGYFTVRFARAVGPAGKVFAVDIDGEMLAYVERRAREEQLANIQTILAEPHDPKLPAASADLIFICDTLHHISKRADYYPLLARALKPGGRLVDIDFEKRDLPLGPPLAMKIAKPQVVKEVEPAGFRLIQEFDFLKYQYFLVFQR